MTRSCKSWRYFTLLMTRPMSTPPIISMVLRMPGRIGINDGIICHVRISIQPLDPSRHNCIRLREATGGMVIPAGVVEHETKSRRAEIGGVIRDVGILSREGVASREGLTRRGVAHLALAKHPRSVTEGARFVAGLNHFAGGGVHGERGGTEVVPGEVGQGGGLRHDVFPHGDSTRSGEVILGHFVAFKFVMPEGAREERMVSPFTTDFTRRPSPLEVLESSIS
ncbi:MAG: hypothetical protein HFACDABA_02472 [Anaerolineales bacterium]|nr:hypothetical protein [Anaerolineales bacterium]